MQRQLGGQPSGERRGHRIPGTGDVMHLQRLGREMPGLRLGDKAQPMLGPRHQHRAEAQTMAQRLGGDDDLLIAIDRQASHPPQALGGWA